MQTPRYKGKAVPKKKVHSIWSKMNTKDTLDDCGDDGDDVAEADDAYHSGDSCEEKLASLDAEQSGMKVTSPIHRRCLHRAIPDDAWISIRREAARKEYGDRTIFDHHSALRDQVDRMNDKTTRLIQCISAAADIPLPGDEPKGSGPAFFNLMSPRLDVPDEAIVTVDSVSPPNVYKERWEQRIRIASLQKEVQYLRKELLKHERRRPDHKVESRGMTPRDVSSHDGSAVTPNLTPRPFSGNDDAIIENFTSQVTSFFEEMPTTPLSNSVDETSELQRLQQELEVSEARRIESEQEYMLAIETAHEENDKLRLRLRAMKMAKGGACPTELSFNSRNPKHKKTGAEKSGNHGGDKGKKAGLSVPSVDMSSIDKPVAGSEGDVQTAESKPHAERWKIMQSLKVYFNNEISA